MMKQRLIGFVFALCTPFCAAAQDTPLIGSQALEPQSELFSPQLSDGVYRILVIGDAMAGGLGAGITRMAAGDDSFEVTSRFNESSGITRPDIYDWASSIPKIMDGKNFNAVVVLIGMNDRQDIRTDTGQLTFNTPEWIKAYQTNIDAIAEALKAQNVKVLWLGEPPMGEATYDADMKAVTALQKDRVTAKGLSFIDTRPLLLASDGSYMDFGPDDTGEMKKLRQRDGVTFLKQGNNKFGQLILAAIKNEANGTPPAVESPPVAAVVPVPLNNPVFGQADANGVAVIQDLKDVLVAANTPTLQTTVTTPSAPATAAEKLFTQGEAAIAPLGRFDDFSYVAPAEN